MQGRNILPGGREKMKGDTDESLKNKYSDREVLEGLIDLYKETHNPEDCSLRNCLSRTLWLDEEYKRKMCLMGHLFGEDNIYSFKDWCLDFASMEYDFLGLRRPEDEMSYKDIQYDVPGSDKPTLADLIYHRKKKRDFFRFRFRSNVDLLVKKVTDTCKYFKLPLEEAVSENWILKIPNEDKTENIIKNHYYPKDDFYISQDEEMPELWVDIK